MKTESCVYHALRSIRKQIKLWCFWTPSVHCWLKPCSQKQERCRQESERKKKKIKHSTRTKIRNRSQGENGWADEQRSPSQQREGEGEDEEEQRRRLAFWMTYPSPPALVDGAGAGTVTVPTLSSLIWMVVPKGLRRYLLSMWRSSSANRVTAMSSGLLGRRIRPFSELRSSWDSAPGRGLGRSLCS